MLKYRRLVGIEEILYCVWVAGFYHSSPPPLAPGDAQDGEAWSLPGLHSPSALGAMCWRDAQALWEGLINNIKLFKMSKFLLSNHKFLGSQMLWLAQTGFLQVGILWRISHTEAEKISDDTNAREHVQLPSDTEHIQVLM